MKAQIDFATNNINDAIKALSLSVQGITNAKSKGTVLGSTIIRRADFTMKMLNHFYDSLAERYKEAGKDLIKNSFGNARKLGHTNFVGLGIDTTKGETLAFKRGVGYSVGTAQKRPAKVTKSNTDFTPELSSVAGIKPETINALPLITNNDEMLALQARIAELEHQLSTQVSLTDNYRDKLADSEKVIKGLNSQVSELSANRDNLQTKLNFVDAQYTSLAVKYNERIETKPKTVKVKAVK